MVSFEEVITSFHSINMVLILTVSSQDTILPQKLFTCLQRLSNELLECNSFVYSPYTPGNKDWAIATEQALFTFGIDKPFVLI